MTDWRCARCRAQVAPGAPRCPQCPSTSFDKPEPEADMLKIARDGSVSDSAEVRAVEAEELYMVHSGDVYGAEGLEVLKVAAEGAAAGSGAGTAAEPDPEVPAPAAPPLAPPRRTPPPGAGVG